MQTAPAVPVLFTLMLVSALPAQQQPSPRGNTSYSPVDDREDFASAHARRSKDKAAVVARHKALLEQRYDLSDSQRRPAPAAGRAGCRARA